MAVLEDNDNINNKTLRDQVWGDQGGWALANFFSLIAGFRCLLRLDTLVWAAFVRLGAAGRLSGTLFWAPPRGFTLVVDY